LGTQDDPLPTFQAPFKQVRDGGFEPEGEVWYPLAHVRWAIVVPLTWEETGWYPV